MDDKIDTNEYILENVTTIISFASNSQMKTLAKLDNKQYMTTLRNKYNEFQFKYPQIFAMIADDPDNFDMQRLKHMLNMKKQVEDNKISHEKASEKLGTEYYNEYVKPLVNELDKK